MALGEGLVECGDRTLRDGEKKQKHQYLLASCSDSVLSDHQETRQGSGIPVSLVHPFLSLLQTTIITVYYR